MNFGEQFVLHTVITGPVEGEGVQDKVQKIFIFTILGISALSLLKELFDDERVNLFLSIAAEIGELIIYATLLKGTLYDNGRGTNNFTSKFGILIYAVPVCIAQVSFLLISYLCRQNKCCLKTKEAPSIHGYLAKKDEQTISIKKRLKDFVMDVVLFIFSNSPPILILFVQEESRFRNLLVNWLILVSFFEGETVEKTPHSVFGDKQKAIFDTRILKYWLGLVQFLDICIFRPLLIIMMVAFAELELSNTQASNSILFSVGDPRPEPLPLYEQITSIFTIVSFVILAVLNIYRFKSWKKVFRRGNAVSTIPVGLKM